MDPNIPTWMTEPEAYSAPKDSDGFLTKSTLTVLGVLSHIRETSQRGLRWASPPVMLLTVLALIVLMALSKNMMFSYVVLAEVLIASLFLSGKALSRSMKTSLSAMAFSMLLLLPAVFSGTPRTMLTVSIKVFISVALLNLVSQTLPFNKITASLKSFRIPDLFIFTLDITLKYIVLLGDVCVNMLNALRLRSVGKNREKGKSVSGILGVTFLKSREMSEEMYGAMTCRGFEGEYVRTRERQLSWKDAVTVLFLAGMVALFVYTQRAIAG
ncbi:MAG: energy-coupling factor transporter transmembrane protein EcfT [Clostridia bacterium]|nr:energy-coupling factor transporter transmembrane protein EcfT [Clostridia bacterium]MBP5459803.1 energy-coupling factor transporter transmembrane protein EcfT [Clostridia bacterium]